MEYVSISSEGASNGGVGTAVRSASASALSTVPAQKGCKLSCPEGGGALDFSQGCPFKNHAKSIDEVAAKCPKFMALETAKSEIALLKTQIGTLQVQNIALERKIGTIFQVLQIGSEKPNTGEGDTRCWPCR